MFTWSARLLIAAVAAVALWFVTPAVLRSGAAHALLSLAMFVGVAIVLALLPWPPGAPGSVLSDAISGARE